MIERFDIVCAIDLDTILPCYFVSVLKNKTRVYDAHEFFTEQKEIVTRPRVYRFWHAIERFAVPKFKHGYTVSGSIQQELKKRYHVDYEVIMNVPVLIPAPSVKRDEKFIIYQGAVNEARGLENLVLAMKAVNVPLHIYGDGNIFEKIRTLVKENQLEGKVMIKGKLSPQRLREVTPYAIVGINLVEPVGLNQLYSLANKFFDYIHAAVPQLTMAFPEYRKINDAFEVAVLADTVEVDEIVIKLNLLLQDTVLYQRLQDNCLRAREIFNWQHEEKRLIQFYERLIW